MTILGKLTAEERKDRTKMLLKRTLFSLLLYMRKVISIMVFRGWAGRSSFSPGTPLALKLFSLVVTYLCNHSLPSCPGGNSSECTSMCRTMRSCFNL